METLGKTPSKGKYSIKNPTESTIDKLEDKYGISAISAHTTKDDDDTYIVLCCAACCMGAGADNMVEDVIL